MASARGGLTARVPRQGRAPRSVRQARVMSHRARRQLAPSPDEAVARVAAEVGRAFEVWAKRFVDLVVRDLLPTRFTERADSVTHMLHLDATIQGLYEASGRATPRREVLESAFKMVDKQSADEVRVAGVRTADVVPGLPAKQAAWVRSNTDLIKAEADLRRRVERVIADPLNEGRSVADIAKLLEEQAGYSKSRAELTARDQTLKLYGQIQEDRQRAAGITRYVWTTSLDERVRKDHAELDGTVQAWDDPPIVDKRAGRRGHPGFDIQCRCTAVPVLDEDDVKNPQVAQEQRAAAAKAEKEGRFRRPAPTPAAPTPPRPPPPEPVMQPTQAELELARRQAESEARRRQLEAEADARIARARAEAERQALAQAEADRLAREAAARQAAEALAAQEQARKEAERRRTPPPAPAKPREPSLSDLTGARGTDVTMPASATPGQKEAVRRGLATAVHASDRLLKQFVITDEIGTARGQLPEGTGGNYDAFRRTLQVSSRSDTNEQFISHLKDIGVVDLNDPKWKDVVLGNTQNICKDIDEVIEMTTVHEYGHHIHMSLGDAHAANTLIQAEFNAMMADPKKYGAVSLYAKQDHLEFWAESFTAYHYYPRAWMKANTPEALRMVENVLKVMGRPLVNR